MPTLSVFPGIPSLVSINFTKETAQILIDKAQKNNYLLRGTLDQKTIYGKELIVWLIIDYWLVPQRFIAGLNLDRLYAIKTPIGYFQLAK